MFTSVTAKSIDQEKRDNIPGKRVSSGSIAIFIHQLTSHLEASLSHLRLVVAYHLLETHADRPARLPVEDLLSAGGVGPALLGVVRGHGLVHDVDARRVDAVLLLDLLDDLADELGKLANGELVTVADVDGTRLVRVHERDEAINEVVDVLEGAGLLAVAVHGHVLTAKRLDNEVRHDTAVKGVH